MKIVFDLDGTLYLTEKSVFRALQATAERFGLWYPAQAQIKPLLGLPTPSFLAQVFGGQIDVDLIAEPFRQSEWQAVSQWAQGYEGIEQLLAQLQNQGHTLHICSAGSAGYIRLVTDALGISHYFQTVYSRDDFPSKADALSLMKGDGQQMLFIGDMQSDYDAAKQSGVPFIFCTYGYGSIPQEDGGCFRVQTPADILTIANQCVVLGAVKQAIRAGQRRLVGINGVDTSGKTLFAMGLSIYLNACGIKNTVIHVDDFHHSRAVRLQGGNEIEAYYNNAFNYGQLINELLIPLKQHGSVHKTVQCLDLDSDQYTNHIPFNIDRDTVVILEGVLLYRQPLLPYFDYKLFIDITFEQVLERAAIRDVPKYGQQFLQRYVDKYIPIQKMYCAQHKPQQCCDMLIDNNDFRCPRIVQQTSASPCKQ